MKKCFMFGNGIVPIDIDDEVFAAVKKAAEAECVEFIVGMRGGFDACARRALRRMKDEIPGIKIYVLLAYRPKGKMELPQGFDGFIYPEGLENVPARFAIVRANRWAVERADHVIAYVRYTTGNSEKLLTFARRKCASVEVIK